MKELSKEIIIANVESIEERKRYWEMRKMEEFVKPDTERDIMYLGTCIGHIDALSGILNVFTVKIK